MRQYRAECVTRYDGILATAAAADELRAGFGAAMAATLREEAQLHRLWYDLRNQSLFDETFRADVQEIDQSLERMIWRIVSKYGELAQAPLAVSSSVAYAIFDGLFQHALIGYLAGGEAAAGALQADIEHILESLIISG